MVRLLTAPLKLAHFNDPEDVRATSAAASARCRSRAERPRYMPSGCTAAAELAGDETVECDVVVIGTGAGGAVVARELAEQGHAVVLLEEGEYHTRADFTGHAVEMQRKLYRDMGATVVDRQRGRSRFRIGRTVGGTTAINSGTCYRAPDRVLRRVARRSSGSTSFAPKHGAATTSASRRCSAWRRRQAKHLGGMARVIARGCDALGYAHRPLRRNAPECDGQGVCCFGCPTDAKRSTNVSLRAAGAQGGRDSCSPALRAERILVENGRAVGVVAAAHARRRAHADGARARGGGGVRLAADAAAARAQRARRRLGPARAQPVDPPGGRRRWRSSTRSIDGGNAIPQGYAIEEFHDEGILFEGAFAPLDIGAAGVHR